MADCDCTQIKVCRKCGEGKALSEFHRYAKGKFGRKSYCKSCALSIYSAYHAANREKQSKKNKLWRDRNVDALRRKKAEHHTLNAQEICKNKLVKKKGYLPDGYQYQPRVVIDAIACTVCGGRIRAGGLCDKHYKAKLRAASPETFVAYRHSRRAREAGAEGRHSGKDIARLRVLQKMRCAVCHADLRGGYHVDHIVPLFLGGSNDKSNLQLLCPTCNTSKGKKHPIDFMQSRGLLL